MARKFNKQIDLEPGVDFHTVSQSADVSLETRPRLNGNAFVDIFNRIVPGAVAGVILGHAIGLAINDFIPQNSNQISVETNNQQQNPTVATKESDIIRINDVSVVRLNGNLPPRLPGYLGECKNIVTLPYNSGRFYCSGPGGPTL